MSTRERAFCCWYLGSNYNFFPLNSPCRYLTNPNPKKSDMEAKEHGLEPHDVKVLGTVNCMGSED